MKHVLGVGVSLVVGFSLSFLISRALTRPDFATDNERLYCVAPPTALLEQKPGSNCKFVGLAEGDVLEPLNRIVRGGVLSVSFSPDGKHLASAGYDAGDYLGLRLWDVSRNTSRVLVPTTVAAADFSPDGKWIAYSSDLRLYLYEVSTGEILSLGKQAAFILALSYSPDGKQIATGSANGEISLWDIKGRSQKVIGRSKNGDVDSVAFSPKGRYLASGGDDGPATIWDLKTGKSSRAEGKAGAEVFGLDFSPDERYLAWAASSQQATPCVWDLKKLKGKCLQNPYPNEKPYTAAFAPNGKSFVVGWSGGGVLVYPTDGEPGSAKTLIPNTGVVYSVAFSPNGKVIATGGFNTVRFWDAKTGKEVR